LPRRSSPASLLRGASSRNPAPTSRRSGQGIRRPLCGGCHDINRLKAGYTPEGWRTVMRMMQNVDVPLTPPIKVAAVTEYLTKSFPERPRPAAAVVDRTRESRRSRRSRCSTPGSRPHDPLAASDGAIWYTGQMTQQARTRRSENRAGQGIRAQASALRPARPHGGQRGNIWFTGKQRRYIGKLDHEDRRRDRVQAARPRGEGSAHARLRSDGILWFTVQQANMLGRLDPKSGAIKLVTSPTPRSTAVRDGGEFEERRVLRRVRHQQGGEHRREGRCRSRSIPLPDAGARPRRIAIGPNDIVWYTDFARGFLGRSTPRPARSPSGPVAERTEVRALRHRVHQRRRLVQRVLRQAEHHRALRSRTEKFQTWSIPGGGDIVRNMDVTRDGNPVLANSLVNQVGIVEIAR
jgi:virginiamycin B lyase